jgi:hypothetical protein
MSKYSEPCPSPNGTNYERLYIIRKPLAMDQAMGSKSGGYGSADNDLDTPDSSDDDLRDQIHQLLEGKLDPADIEALLTLIEGPDTDTAPAPGRQAHDGWRPTLALDALMRRRVAESGVARAERAQKQIAGLMARFPALKNARVV